MSEILSSKDIVTRKTHKCFGCQLTYPRGTRMKRSSVADDGTVFTAYLCETCQEVERRILECDDTYGEGELRGGDSEYWEEVKRELEMEEGC